MKQEKPPQAAAAEYAPWSSNPPGCSLLSVPDPAPLDTIFGRWAPQSAVDPWLGAKPECINDCHLEPWHIAELTRRTYPSRSIFWLLKTLPQC